jgi:hypothetical protein
MTKSDDGNFEFFESPPEEMEAFPVSKKPIIQPVDNVNINNNDDDGFDPSSRPAIGLTATYSAALERIGKADTPDGALVLHLASMLEFGYGESLSAKASMAGQLMKAWASISGGVPAESDALDEITARRKRKFG